MPWGVALQFAERNCFCGGCLSSQGVAGFAPKPNFELTCGFKKIEKLLYPMMNVYERELQAPYLICGICDFGKGDRADNSLMMC